MSIVEQFLQTKGAVIVNGGRRWFAGIVEDAKSQKGLDKRENWSCRQGNPTPPEDPRYTIRAWRGVVTYPLRRQEFLYE